jgi:DNA mismatch repair protein MutL
VNVHPSKKEVRFREDQTVRDFVTGAVRETLRSKTSEPLAVGLATRGEAEAVESQASALPVPQGTPAAVPDWFAPEKPASVAALRSALPMVPFAEPEQVPFKSGFQAKNHDLHVLGVIMNLYIVAENPDGVVLIDQHAAHERVLFEQMLDRVAQEEVLSQRLLLPVTLELPPEQADFLRGQIEGLNQVGLSVADMGSRTFMVDGLPPMIKTQAVEDFFRAMLVDLQQEGGRVRQERRLSEEIIAKTVCRHAVKANDSLSLPEVEKLLVDLHACELPYTCPHGRPTMIMISKPELEKKFGRVI